MPLAWGLGAHSAQVVGPSWRCFSSPFVYVTHTLTTTLLVQEPEGRSFVRVLLLRGRVQGAVLIGQTGEWGAHCGCSGGYTGSVSA